MRHSTAIRLTLALAAIMIAAAVSVAQDTSAQENRKAALEREIAQLELQIKENVSRSSSALNDLTLVRRKVEARKELLAESERELKMINDSVSLTRRKVRELQARIDTLSLYYEKLVRSAYRNRDAKMWYVYILSSDSFSQATRRFAYLRSLSERMNAEAQVMQELRAEQEKELDRLGALQAEAKKVRDERALDLKRLQAEEKRSADLVGQLQRYRSKYQGQLNSKRKQVEALNKEIERIIAQHLAAQQKASGQGDADKKESRTVDYKLAASFEANKGKLPWPAEGPILEKYGRHSHPVYKSIVMPFNNGISIGVAKGTEVRAVFDGEVTSVIVMPGYNKCVMVQHGSYFTFYCKLDKVNVKQGDKVKTGEVLGTVDTIDGQTMLHFQIWKEKSPQNPELWLR